MSVTPTAERAARARAARGYAAVTQKDMAKALNVSVETLSRMENGRRTISIEELIKISAVCNVPFSFMEFGFEVVADAAEAALMKTPHHGGAVEDRLEALEDVIPTVVDQLASIEAALLPKPTDAQVAPATLEEALERLAHATDVIQRLERRLGENLGRRDIRYRAARDRSQEPPPPQAAA